MLFLSGCSKNYSTGNVEVNTFIYSYTAISTIDGKPIDIEAKTFISLETNMPEDTEVIGTLRTESGDFTDSDKCTVSFDKGVSFRFEPFPSNYHSVVNGKYKLVISFTDKKNKKVELSPIDISITEGYSNQDVAKAGYDEYIAAKEGKEKADSDAVKQKQEDGKQAKQKTYTLKSNTYLTVGKDLPAGRIKITATKSSVAEVTVTTKFISERYRGYMGTGSKQDKYVTLDVENDDIIMINTPNSAQVLQIIYEN